MQHSDLQDWQLGVIRHLTLPEPPHTRWTGCLAIKNGLSGGLVLLTGAPGKELLAQYDVQPVLQTELEGLTDGLSPYGSRTPAGLEQEASCSPDQGCRGPDQGRVWYAGSDPEFQRVFQDEYEEYEAEESSRPELVPDPDLTELEDWPAADPDGDPLGPGQMTLDDARHEISLADCEIFYLREQLDDIRQRLRGLPSSQLDGANGLAAATINSHDRLLDKVQTWRRHFEQIFQENWRLQNELQQMPPGPTHPTRTPDREDAAQE